MTDAGDQQTWPKCATCAIRPRTLYADLDGGGAEQLQQTRRRQQKFPAKRVILRENEKPEELYTLFEGWAFRFRLLPGGQRQILSFLLPGDFVSFQVLKTGKLHFSVQTLTDVTVCVFDADVITRFFQSRPLLIQSLGIMGARESAYLDSRITDLGRRSAIERVACLVLEIEERARDHRIAKDNSFPFPLLQEHIADTLGLTIVHVSRTIARLKAGGLISLDAGWLTIRDRSGLNELAKNRIRLPPRFG